MDFTHTRITQDCQSHSVFVLISSPLSLVVDPLGHLHLHPVQLLGHADLAAQPGGVGEAVGQVEHVQLLVGGLVLDFLKVGLLEDQVASRAGWKEGFRIVFKVVQKVILN